MLTVVIFKYSLWREREGGRETKRDRQIQTERQRERDRERERERERERGGERGGSETVQMERCQLYQKMDTRSSNQTNKAHF